LVRVILKTVLEMTRKAALDAHRTRLTSETGKTVAPTPDPYALELTPLLYKYRPKDESPATFENGYRHGKWIDRPIVLQVRLLELQRNTR